MASEVEPARRARIAAIQMVSGPLVGDNLTEAGRLIAQAAARGAQLAALPEYFCILGMKDTDKVAVREAAGDGPIQRFLSDTAKKHGIWIVGGSAPLACADPGRVRNSSLVYNAEGSLVARYDKIHLFGFQMGEERYHEAGRQDFDQNFDFYFKVNAGQVIMDKFKRFNPSLQPKKAKKNGLFNVYVHVFGNAAQGKYDWKMDKKGVQDVIKADEQRRFAGIQNTLTDEFNGVKALEEPSEMEDVPEYGQGKFEYDDKGKEQEDKFMWDDKKN